MGYEGGVCCPRHHLFLNGNGFRCLYFYKSWNCNLNVVVDSLATFSLSLTVAAGLSSSNFHRIKSMYTPPNLSRIWMSDNWDDTTGVSWSLSVCSWSVLWRSGSPLLLLHWIWMQLCSAQKHSATPLSINRRIYCVNFHIVTLLK